MRMFCDYDETSPQALVDGSDRDTSQHLLRVLDDEYHLMQHLKVCVCVCAYARVCACVCYCYLTDGFLLPGHNTVIVQNSVP